MLLEHNIPVYEKLKETLAKNKDAIIVTATGTGKSYLVAEYIEEYNLNALVICPRRSLCTYWTNLSHNVSTMTYHYFGKHIDELINIGKIMDFFDIFIFDEAHHAGAQTWSKAIEKFKTVCTKPIIGLTADPVRYTDGAKDVSIEIWDGNIVEGYSLEQSVGTILPSIKYVCALYDVKGLMKDIPAGVSKELIKQLEYSIENSESCVEILQTEIEGDFPHKGVVFVDKIDNIEKGINIITEAFPNEKVWAIHSKQSNKLNDTHIHEFNSSESGFIITVDMLNEGVHIDTVDVVIMLRKTSSPTLFFQQIGRGLSVTGKTLQIFDFVANHSSLKITSSVNSCNIKKLLNIEINDERSEQSIIGVYHKEPIRLINEINKSLSTIWTEEEDEIIKKYYPIEGPKVSERLPGRSNNACKCRACELHICKDNRRRWTEEEDEIIKKYYPIEGSKVSERLPSRNTAVCIHRATNKFGLSYDKSWTKEEDEIIKKYYPIEGSKVSERLPGRTISACNCRSNYLNVSKMERWTEEEDEIIKKYYPIEGPKVSERLPGRSRQSCVYRAGKLKIHSDKRSYWTDEEDEIIKKYYPIEGSKVSERLPSKSILSCIHRARGLKLSSDIIWTDEEDEIIKKYYPIEGSKVSERLPGRTISACKSRAIRLNIANKQMPWTEEEDEIIKKYYPIEGPKVSERLPGRAVSTCRARAKRLNVSKMERWTEEEDEIIKKYYPIEGSKVSERLPGRTESACMAHARTLGVRYKKKKDS